MDGPQQNTKSWSGLLLLCRRTLIAWPSLLHNHSRVRAVRAQKAAHKDGSVCGLCEPCQFKWLLRVQKKHSMCGNRGIMSASATDSAFTPISLQENIFWATSHIFLTHSQNNRGSLDFFTLILHMEPERRQSVSTLCYTVCR